MAEVECGITLLKSFMLNSLIMSRPLFARMNFFCVTFTLKRFTFCLSPPFFFSALPRPRPRPSVRPFRAYFVLNLSRFRTRGGGWGEAEKTVSRT